MAWTPQGVGRSRGSWGSTSAGGAGSTGSSEGAATWQLPLPVAATRLHHPGEHRAHLAAASRQPWPWSRSTPVSARAVAVMGASTAGVVAVNDG